VNKKKVTSISIVLMLVVFLVDFIYINTIKVVPDSLKSFSKAVNWSKKPNGNANLWSEIQDLQENETDMYQQSAMNEFVEFQNDDAIIEMTENRGSIVKNIVKYITRTINISYLNIIPVILYAGNFGLVGGLFFAVVVAVISSFYGIFVHLTLIGSKIEIVKYTLAALGFYSKTYDRYTFLEVSKVYESGFDAMQADILWKIVIFVMTGIIVGKISNSIKANSADEVVVLQDELRKVNAKYVDSLKAEDELKEVDKKIMKLSNRIISLQNLAKVLGSSMEVNSILQEICRVTEKLVSASEVSIFFEKNGILNMVESTTRSHEDCSKIKIKVGEGVIGYAYKERMAISESQLKSDFKLQKLEQNKQVPITTVLPLISIVEGEEETLGLLTIGPYKKGIEKDDKEIQDDGRALSLITTLGTMSIKNARLYEQTQRMANVDELTQMYNNRYFRNFLLKEMKKADEYGTKVTLIFGDIDHFKKFNDSYGHLIGDMVLKETARTMVKTAREQDLPARYGGEEFCIVLTDTDTEEAYEQAERHRRAIEAKQYDTEEFGVLSVTISLGIATYPTHSIQSVKALVKAADDALYLAKEGGRNQCQICQKAIMEEPGE
jgi:diguanylate cyclase (GGDEF)-like protein